MIKRTRLVYSLLIAVWALIVVWQVGEHDRVKQSARATLINRAKDISNTLGLVLRSQRRFGGVISRDRLESALNELVKPGELNGIALLNAVGAVVASVGAPIDLEGKGLVPTGAYWGDETVTLMNLVDLGTNVTSEPEANRPTIVVPRGESPSPGGTNFPGPPPPRPSGPPPEFAPEADRGLAPETRGNATDPTNAESQAGPPRGWPRRGGREGRWHFGRPPWLSEEDYQALLQKQGVHSFVLMLSTQAARAASRQDFWLRLIISGFAAVSAVGLAGAWRNTTRSSELEVRLVRAAELNNRLKEMNLAAAGLAHETKNPLNIIRGLAQMISKQPDVSAEVRQKSSAILDEAERVTSQLNEFINFSRPREVRRAAVSLGPVVAEVVRALGHDREEKGVRLQVQSEMPTIEADEQLLRQTLFNLLLNAIQAVAQNGEMHVLASKAGASEATLEIRDNGPGVPAERRRDIFKPYFTTNQNGTGLGLAVVEQIVLAHGWEIECLPNEPRGAIFRISHVRLAASA